MPRLIGICLAFLVVLGAIVWLRSDNAIPPKNDSPSENEPFFDHDPPRKGGPASPTSKRITSDGKQKPSPRPRSAPIEWGDDLLTRDRLQVSIHRAANYLVRHCQADGRFVYLTHVDPQTKPRKGYNVLRHLGAMYALAMYQEKFPRPETIAALLRANEFLKKNALGPVPNAPGNMLAVWSRPAVVPSVRVEQAKLGGSGLALIAFCKLNQVRPKTVPPETLERLARFVVFMQKESGEFVCKYIPSQGGKSDRFVSQYYPGEAALGLLMLHASDGNKTWFDAAARAVYHLAKIAPVDKPTIPDHWMLLACRYLAPQLQSVDKSIPVDLIRRHLERTLADMVADQLPALEDREIGGSFTPDGRSCPTATRLEGMLASLSYVPLHKSALRSAVEESSRVGMKFLLSCQVTEGPLAGGFTCVSPKLKRKDPRIRPAVEKQMGEIRIDYVQHALSSMLQYLDRLESRKAR